MLHPTAFLEFRQWHQEKLGRRASALRLAWHWLRHVAGGPAIAPVRLDKLRHPVYLRPWSSDLYVFEQIFIDCEYDTPLPEPTRIIDAGANIGLASVYFANRFPAARIVALEPDPENFAMLQINTARYPNIRCVHAGLWSHRTELSLANAGEKSWALRFTAAGCEGFIAAGPEAAGADEAGPTVPAMNVDEVSDTCFGGEAFDLVKIDIEGAEKEVFAAGGRWLGEANSILVECHDRLIPDCEATVLRAARAAGFSQRRSGEYLVLDRRVDRPVPHG